jgi:hypothetical protein
MATATLETETLVKMKADIIRRIENIDNAETTAQIAGRLEGVVPKYPSFFTPELIADLRAGVIQGQKDHAAGLGIDSDELMKEFDKWLVEDE